MLKKNFKDLYNDIYSKNSTELEGLRKPKISFNKTHVMQVLFLIIISIFSNSIAGILFVFGLAISIYIRSKQTDDTNLVEKCNEYNNRYEKYKKCFKEKVIEPLIENVFEEGSFNPNDGIARLEYEEGRFRDHIDLYKTEDLITAKIKGVDGLNTNVRFAEVQTQKEYTGSDGDRSYQTVFYGLVGIVDLNKNINDAVYVKKNWSVSSFNKNQIKMDMSEFEKIFDVEAKDKILALRILTSEVMTEITDLYNKYKIGFEVHIINNKIYMRLETGSVFEPNVFQHSLEYETVEKYYLILQAAMNISKHIYDTVCEIEL